MRSLLQTRPWRLGCAALSVAREPVIRLRRGGYRVMPPAGVMQRAADAARRGEPARLNRAAWCD
jgi:hypothetical protein